MASSASTVIRLELMANGENDGTWGTKTNTNMQMVESAVAGIEAISLGASDVTLTDVDFVNDQAKKRVLDCTGTLTASVNIIVPNRARLYYLINRTTGGFTVTIKTPSGSGKVVTQGGAADMYIDGADNVLFVGSETITTTGAPATAAGAAASSIAVTPTGNLAADDVQEGLAELQTDIDAINAAASNYQPIDSDLTDLAALSVGKGNTIVANGTIWTSQAVGPDGYVVVADSAQAAGLKYESIMPALTKILCIQTAAPTGYTKDVVHNDKALRVVSGTASSGGTVAFETALASQVPTGTVAGHVLTTAEMPAHTHDSTGLKERGNGERSSSAESINTTEGAAHVHTTTSVGGDSSHTHGWTGDAINLDVQFVDTIIVTKDAL